MTKVFIIVISGDRKGSITGPNSNYVQKKGNNNDQRPFERDKSHLVVVDYIGVS